jgi:hypothetical protein
MNKPKGGRGKVARYPTIMRRIPEGIKEAVEQFSDLYRSSAWDGRVEPLNLNLISGNGNPVDLVILVQQLLSKLADEGGLQSLPSELREELLEWVQRESNSQTQKPDIKYNQAMSSSYQEVETNEEIEESTLHTQKPDIGYNETELIRNVKESKTLIKKLERQVKAQAEQIQRLSQRVNERRKEREEYKQKFRVIRNKQAFLPSVC